MNKTLTATGHARELITLADRIPEHAFDARTKVLWTQELASAHMNFGEFDRSFDLLEEVVALARTVGLTEIAVVAQGSQLVCALSTGRGDPVAFA